MRSGRRSGFGLTGIVAGGGWNPSTRVSLSDGKRLASATEACRAKAFPIGTSSATRGDRAVSLTELPVLVNR